MPINMEEETIAPSDSALTKIADLGKTMVALEAEIAKMDEERSAKAEELKAIQEGSLPEAMSEAGLSEFKTKDGAKITIKPYYSAKINAENGEECHSWLRDNGFGDLIKNEVVVSLGMGQDDITVQIKEFAEDLGLKTVTKEQVHSSTLSAFVKEQVESGSDFPLELFHVYVGSKAKVTLPKT